MLLIARLQKSADTISKNWYVHCKRPRPPASAETVVQDIVRYATYPVGAYRLQAQTGIIEYLVEFETTDGFIAEPRFYTVEKLRAVVQRILNPYYDQEPI